MTIRIELPESDGIKTCCGTKVFNQDGREITDITNISINLAPDAILTAVIDVSINDIKHMDNIYALLGAKTLHEIASLHGWELKRIPTIRAGHEKNVKKG